ncbi:MAG TPA: G1 family glutamic endopeptidase [Streptosporangiaceae bacterium]|nr:G1 family glutamic endopeptidase [Streptosporangiaceae bacterium]
MRILVVIGSLALSLTATPVTPVQSANWAGYYLSGASGAYTSVSASFTAPAATCKATGSSAADFWVGLDGFSSDSVEQVGIDEECTSGTASYVGWYDLYPAAPVYFSSTVSPGDSMSASVTFSGTASYTFGLSDSTQGWTHTITKVQSGLERSSAEIVTSGPGASSNGIGPTLLDFGKITYTACKVNGTSMGTQDPTEVEMVDADGRVMVSPSAMTAAGKFTNTWLRGN